MTSLSSSPNFPFPSSSSIICLGKEIKEIYLCKEIKENQFTRALASHFSTPPTSSKMTLPFFVKFSFAIIHEYASLWLDTPPIFRTPFEHHFVSLFMTNVNKKQCKFVCEISSGQISSIRKIRDENDRGERQLTGAPTVVRVFR